MRITVLGTGYVGLVTGACLAELGNHVTCMDINSDKIAALKRGEIPIYEPGLETLVKRNQAEGRLEFITDLCVQKESSEIYYVAVGTPSDENGFADLQYVLAAVRMIGRQINQYCVIVDKSTVPVGVADQVHAAVQEELDKRGLKDLQFDVVSNPEFLKEGAAIEDFMKPDRLVVGYPSEKAKAMMAQLYAPIIRNHGGKILYMAVKDAEMTKYAVNAMLATRISFMNEIAGMCEKLGVDVDNVRQGIGSDSRVGEKFLFPGCGYGGSCFPKDVKALVGMAKEQGYDPIILEAVEARNALQKHVLVQKVFRVLGENLTGIKIAVWGLAFKPETDDMREASSLVFIQEMIRAGAKIVAYDPVAKESAKRMFPEGYFSSGRLNIVDSQYAALDGAEILVVLTEWKSFLYPDLEIIKTKLKQAVIIDGRNIYDPHEMQRAGFLYSGIGRGMSLV
ncbi:MAG: UDP-glucose/GDP-mannose dehydrogenase family protein [Gammaproteobacteria bacterium]|nr:UDP-glucose/GDP-mannose dehydrogenase family protein [Gammaproteobacteria bacterium]